MTEEETKVLETGQPRNKFHQIIKEKLGPSMQGLSDAQLYFNWCWTMGYAEEERCSIYENDSYTIAEIPITDIAKEAFPEYAKLDHVFLDHDNQGMIHEHTESDANKIILALDEEVEYTEEQEKYF